MSKSHSDSKAISFSRWGLYNNCPASYEWQYVLGNKRPFTPGGAAARGTEIHNSIEDAYNLLDVTLLHDEIPEKMRPKILEHYDKCPDIRPEWEFALTVEWELTDFEGDLALTRGYMDNVFLYPERAVVHEYKTGQEYPEHPHQKALYGMTILSAFPEYNEVTVEGIYIDKKKVVPTTYMRAQLFGMQYHWKREFEKMSIPIYPARPGRHCMWCNKSMKQDGPCKVG